MSPLTVYGAMLPPPGETEVESAERPGANAARMAARAAGKFPARVDGAPAEHQGVPVGNETGYFTLCGSSRGVKRLGGVKTRVAPPP